MNKEVIELLEKALSLLKQESLPIPNAPSDEFQQLTKLLNSKEWPTAVNPDEICSDSEQHKINRADGILDYMDESLSNKSFLDFGCGEGHVAIRASEIATKAIGYDIKDSHWRSDLLTTDFQKVKDNGPYDIILAFDVLDHCNDPIEALNQIRSVCSHTTKIFVRCHPWMSRHAIHAYHTINKAFIHLVFSEEELAKLGITESCEQKVFFPVDTAKEWFTKTNFEITQHDTINEPVEKFFSENPLIKGRLPLQVFKQFPEWQMSIVFNDFILKTK